MKARLVFASLTAATGGWWWWWGVSAHPGRQHHAQQWSRSMPASEVVNVVRHVQRRMAAHMESRHQPLAVRSGLLEGCRDWKSWLANLDFIHERGGLEGIMSCHWLSFCRRRDLPLECAGQPLAAGPGSEGPDDIMLMAKKFMSNRELIQPPLLFLHAGASAHLAPPTGPPTWEPRATIDQAPLERLCRKVLATLPSRADACQYLRQWMAMPRAPGAAPGTPVILVHRYNRPLSGGSIGQVFQEALQAEADDVQRQLHVKRRRGAPSQRHVNVSLPTYVDFRLSQGISVQEAVHEWNGGHILRTQGS